MVRPDRTRIIGGMFGLGTLQYPDAAAPDFLDGTTVCLANASSGIHALIEQLRPTQVWMPSYLCPSMLRAASSGQHTTRFYAVDERLCLSSLDWIKEVRRNDLVVFIDYFGFPGDTGFLPQVRSKGAWILEDACQALLSKQVGRQADYVVYSPRKFLGVPDGGVLQPRREAEIETASLKPAPAPWWSNSLQASLLRRAFDDHGGDREWFALFQETEAASPVGLYSMSELSGLLLRHGFDYQAISERRAANYRYLSAHLDSIALLPQLPQDVVPLGFPIRVDKRDVLRQGLFEQEIYPPVHWDLHDTVPVEFEDSHRLAAEIMTLPCDQRYRERDMRRMVEAVRSLLDH